MKIGRGSRRSFRYSVFIGVLVGSIFSGSGAFAEVISLSEISTQITDGNVSLVAGATYEAGNPADTFSFGSGSTYFGDFSGTFAGNGATITGLTVPLFNIVGATTSNISNVVLIASAEDGLSGNGILANSVLSGSTIDRVQATGNVTSFDFEVGGLIGNSGATISNSSSSGTVTGISKVGGLVGVANGSISNSNSTSNVLSSGGNQIGGLVGEGSGTIENSNASGSVTSANGFYIGGLAGSTTGNVLNSFSSGAVEGSDGVGGLIGYARNVDVVDSYSTSLVTGHSDNVGGLIGDMQGSVSRSFSTGGVISSANYVGGLIGRMEGEVSNTYSTSTVTVNSPYLIQRVGGLVGGIQDFSLENSYSSGAVNTTIIGNSGSLGNIGNSYVAGLIGSAFRGDVINSYSSSSVAATIEASDTGLLDSVSANNSYIAGLIGFAIDVNVNNSISTGSIVSSADVDINGDVTNNLTVTSTSVGGLIGYAGCSSACSPSNLTISSAGSSGNVLSHVHVDVEWVHGSLYVYNEYVGKFIGLTNDINISDSNSTSEVVVEKYKSTYALDGALNFYNQNVGNLIGLEGSGTNLIEVADEYSVPSLIATLAKIGSSGSGQWNVSSYCNGNLPYLVTLESVYSPSCTAPVISTNNRREKNVREGVETRTPEKIEKSLGFKNETPLPKNAPIAFVESTEKIDLAKVKAVDVVPTANVRVSAKAGEALQISLKSESKEPVELWVKSPDGSWLLAGVINFDKDGKAILPPLQFKKVGDYTLVLNKPSADSAKGGAPLNQSGSVLVAVS